MILSLEGPGNTYIRIIRASMRAAPQIRANRRRSSHISISWNSFQVEDIKQWLWREENYTKIHPLKLNVLLQEVSTQPVAISAYGCITVNYSTFGSVSRPTA
jgi:hypothetical protein